MTLPTIDAIADRATTWVGSTPSLIVHTLFFLCSFLGHALFKWDYSEILLTLTTVVSLEAIYISIFIQRAVNQQSVRLQDVEESIDEVEESITEVEKSLDEVEESITEVEKSIDEVEESIDEVEKSIEDVEDALDEEEAQHTAAHDSADALTLEVKKLVKELRAARLAAEAATKTIAVAKK